MKVINATTIETLVSAYLEGDDQKFMAYANFIADAYEEAGEPRSARIIRKKSARIIRKKDRRLLQK